MSETPVPQKPIPQFTIRWLLGLMTGTAVVFSIIAVAMRKYLWALCISVGVGTLVLFMLIGALLFSIIWIFTGFSSSRNSTPIANPPPLREVKAIKDSEFLSDGE